MSEWFALNVSSENSEKNTVSINIHLLKIHREYSLETHDQ